MHWKPLFGTVALAGALLLAPAHLFAATEAPAAVHTETATFAQADCSWTGTWGSAFSAGDTVKSLVVVVEQAGADVAGGYAYLEDSSKTGSFTASVAGPIASGAWAEGGATGRFVLAMSDDCNTWAGTWGNDASADDGGVWAGSRAG